MRTITKEMFCASLNSIQKEKERMKYDGKRKN